MKARKVRACCDCGRPGDVFELNGNSLCAACAHAHAHQLLIVWGVPEGDRAAVLSELLGRPSTER
jgi:hypothetical protein